MEKRKKIQSFLWIKSVRGRMICSFSLLLIGALAVVQLSGMYFFRAEIENNLMAAVKNSLGIGMFHIEAQLADAQSFAVNLMAEDEVQYALTADIARDSFDYDLMLRRLEQTARKAATSRVSVKKVLFINENGEILDSLLDKPPDCVSALLQEKLPDGNRPIMSEIHQEIYEGSRVEVISVLRRVYHARQGTLPIGVVVVELDAELIKNAVMDFDLPAEGHVLLMDSEGQLIYESGGGFSKEVSKIYTGEGDLQEGYIVNPEKIPYICSGVTSKDIGWRLVSVIPQKALLSGAARQRNFTLCILFLCIIAAIMVSSLIVGQVSAPIKVLLKSMKEVEGGKLDSHVSYSGMNEMQQLVDGYNSMTKKIEKLLSGIRQKEEQKRNAELHALQAEISPHFLYNSLSSIRYLAWEHKLPDITSATSSLINLCRASLDANRFVTIEQELELAEDYIELAKIRYGDIASYSIRRNPKLANCLIPRFSIQPLVENALFHGISPAESGKITVAVEEDELGDIRIRVEDTGQGIEKDRLEEIRSYLESDGSKSKAVQEDSRHLKSIGLANINQRIKLYYPGKYGITIKSSYKLGTCVEMRVPAVRNLTKQEGAKHAQGDDRR